jgi:hypothetical protein
VHIYFADELANPSHLYIQVQDVLDPADHTKEAIITHNPMATM